MKPITVCIAASALACLVFASIGVAGPKECESVQFTGPAVLIGEWWEPPPVEILDLMDQCYSRDIVDQFQFCMSNPITGTVSGDWILCGNYGFFQENKLGFSALNWTNPGLIRTKQGLICTAEQSLSAGEGERFFFVALEEITGGTGKYGGATGWLAIQKPISHASKGRFSFGGWICRP